MMFLLDTNILSERIKKRPNPHLLERLSSHRPEALFTSVICVMELRMGSALRDDFEDFWKKSQIESHRVPGRRFSLLILTSVLRLRYRIFSAGHEMPIEG